MPQAHGVLGRIYGAMFIGIAVGPLISSYIIYLAGQDNPLLVFYICLVRIDISG